MLFFGCPTFLKNYYTVGFLVFILNSMNILAQDLMPIVARLNSMGNTAVALTDAFSLFSNPSCIAKDSKQSAAVFVDHRYGIAGLNTKAFAYNHAINDSKMAGGFTHFGDELMNHSRIELAFAQKIRLFSLGGGFGVHHLSVSGNGVARAVTFQFGGLVEISPKIYYGAHVYNMTRAKISKESSLYYPVLMKTGFTYLPSDLVILSAEIEKDSRYPVNLKAGLEYKLIEWIKIRTGINSSPANGYFGLGFKLKEWNFDYGLSFHSRLGVVHFVGLTFELNQKPPIIAEP